MSLSRGIQSALFYYLSCAPCTGYTARRKCRKEANRIRKEKEQLRLENPDSYYHHPSPFMTNIYWSEEISIGPGPPPRRSGKKSRDGAQRAIHTAGTQSSVGSNTGSSLDFNGISPTDTTIPSNLLDAQLDGQDDTSWNRRRYQREDEELWGLRSFASTKRSNSRKGLQGSSVGLAGIRRTASARSESYYTARNPPVNDLHPPVVSTPAPNPDHIRWMLQPPPSAKIMSGKERACSRSRHDSASSTLGSEGTGSGHASGPKQVDRKCKFSESPKSRSLSRASSSNTVYTQPRSERTEAEPRPIVSRPQSRNTRNLALPQAHGDSSSEDVQIERRKHRVQIQFAADINRTEEKARRRVRPPLSQHKLSTISSSRGCSSSSGGSLRLHTTSDLSARVSQGSGAGISPGMLRRSISAKDSHFSPATAAETWNESSDLSSSEEEDMRAEGIVLAHRNPRIRWSTEF